MVAPLALLSIKNDRYDYQRYYGEFGMPDLWNHTNCPDPCLTYSCPKVFIHRHKSCNHSLIIQNELSFTQSLIIQYYICSYMPSSQILKPSLNSSLRNAQRTWVQQRIWWRYDIIMTIIIIICNYGHCHGDADHYFHDDHHNFDDTDDYFDDDYMC